MMAESEKQGIKILFGLLICLFLIFISVSSALERHAEQLQNNIAYCINGTGGIRDQVRYARYDIQNLIVIGKRFQIDTAPLQKLHDELAAADTMDAVKTILQFNTTIHNYILDFEISGELYKSSKDNYLYTGIVKRLRNIRNLPVFAAYSKAIQAYKSMLESFPYRQLLSENRKTLPYPEVIAE